ncbi:CvpA family protein [Robertkochia solimangrovi]|uniref:CvpA family protein n=1 Tax=Robertkochia solimangrovi TaxID=2213046 RepID=UPI001180E790|nr:CvpA family protein [Robertkochia solimangrovi]TRZ45871.1 CvpA family protein [Robertkochia solimangrovi]
MNFIDIVLGGLLLFGLIRGLMKGFFIEVASLVALIAGIYGAIHFSYFAGDYLSSKLEWEERYINLTAFAITFVIIIIAIAFLGKLLTKIANMAALGLLNRILGGIFGCLKFAVILGAFLLFFDKTNNTLGLLDKDQTNSSILYEPVKAVGSFVFDSIFNTKEDNLEVIPDLRKA